MPTVSLSPDQRTRLHQAMLAAYGSPPALDTILRRLDRTFALLSRNGLTYQDDVMSIIGLAESGDWLVRMLAEVRRDLPGDPQLAALEKELTPVAPAPGLDHFDVCRLSGRNVMIDRAPLRAALRDMTELNGRRILVVTG